MGVMGMLYMRRTPVICGDAVGSYASTRYSRCPRSSIRFLAPALSISIQDRVNLCFVLTILQGHSDSLWMCTTLLLCMKQLQNLSWSPVARDRVFEIVYVRISGGALPLSGLRRRAAPLHVPEYPPHLNRCHICTMEDCLICCPTCGILSKSRS